MSAVIDERVVKMEFDNKDFEKNVSTSLSTLDKLKNALSFTKQKEEVETLGRVINDTKFDGMADAVDKIANRFTFLGTIAQNIKEKIANEFVELGQKIITAIPNQIKEGGWNRALNVEQAKFTLEGLGVAWEEVADDIDHAVLGTAYGADEAAKAAAQLAASGVQYGGVIGELEDGTEVYSDMGRALRGISGVAAMTNSSFSEIAHIFTTIAGNGKIMTEQLNQFSYRGLNVAAALADVWNTTEEEVRDMVHHGEVDFQLFADAMDLAFGEHATAANKTLEGSMSNMKAALSRIGQDFAQTIMQQTPQMFNALKELFNKMRKYTKPFADYIFTPLFSTALRTITDFIDKINDSIPDMSDKLNWFFKNSSMIDSLRIGLEGVFNVFKAIGSIISPIAKAFADIFITFDLFGSLDGIGKATRQFEELTRSLILTEDQSKLVYDVFEIIFKVLKDIIWAIGELIHVMSPITKVFGALLKSAVRIVNAFIDLVNKVRGVEDAGDRVKNVFDSAYNVVDKFADVLVKGIEHATDFSEVLIGDYIYKFITFITDAVQKVKDFNEQTGLLSNIFRIIKDAVSIPLGFIAKLVEGLYNVGKAILSIPEVQAFLQKIREELSGFGGVALEGIKKFAEYLSKVDLKRLISDIKDAISKLLDKVKEFFNYLADKFKIVGMIRDEFEKTFDQFKKLRGGVSAHTLYDEFVTPMEEASGAAFNLKEIITKVTDRIKEFFSTLDINQLLLIGYAGAIIVLFVAIWKLVKSFTNLADAATGVMGAIRGIIKRFSGGNKLKLTEIATSIALITASLIALALVDKKYHENLIQAGIVLGILAAAFVVFAGALTGISILLNKFSSWKDLLSVEGSMIALSGSVLMLSVALNKLQGIDLGKAQESILIIAELSLVMSGLSILISRFAGSGFKGFLTLLAFAVVVSKFADAMDKITNLNYKNVADNIDTVIIIFGGLAVAAMAASQIGLFSAVGLLFFVGVIGKVIPMLSDISTSDYSAILEALDENIEVVKTIGVLLAVMTVIAGLFGKGIKKFGTGMILLSIGLLLMSKAISILGKMDYWKVKQGLKAVEELLIVVGVITLILSLLKGGKGAVKVSVAMGFLVLSLYPIAGAIWILGSMDPNKVNQGTKAIEGLMVCFALIIAASKLPGKGVSFLTMLGIVASIVLLTVNLMALTEIPFDKILGAAVGLDLVMAGLALVFVSLAAVGNQKAPFRAVLQILAVVGVIYMIGDALVKLVPYPWENIISATGGIALVLVALSAAYIVIGKTNWEHIYHKTTAFLLMCISLYAIMGAIWVLAKLRIDRMIAAAISLAGVVYAMSLVFKAISKADTDPKKAFAFSVMCLSLVEAGFAMSMLANMSWGRMLSATIALSATLLAASKAFDIIGSSVTEGGDVVKFLIMCLSLVEIAIPLAVLANMPWEGLISAGVSLSILVLALSKAFDIIGSSVTEVGDVAKFLLMCLSLFEIGVPLFFLAAMPWDSMLAAAGALSLVLLAMTAAFDIVGLSVANVSDIGLFLLMTLSLIPIGLALYVLSEQHWENMLGVAASISMLLLAFTAVTVILQLVNPALAIEGCLGFIAVLAILMLVFGAIAALIELIPDDVFNWILRGFDKFIIIAGKVGEVIGAFIGGILGGGVMQLLIGIGKGLSQFAVEADPFVKWISEIDESLADGAEILCRAMLAFAGATASAGGADLLDFILHPVKSIGGAISGKDYNSAAEMLVTMGEALSDFAWWTEDIDIDQFVPVVEAAADLFEADFPDASNFSEFDGDLLWDFGEGLCDFCEAVESITDATVVDPAIEIAQKIFNLHPPNQGGWLGAILGDNNLEFFNEEVIGSFGKGIFTFVKSVSQITDPNVCDPALNIANKLFALKPPNEGGWLGDILGENNFELFNSEKLGTFGNGLWAFVKSTASITDATMADEAIGLAKKLFALHPPNQGGFIADILGDNNFSKFNKRSLGKFGEGIAAFVENTSSIGPGDVISAQSACAIAEMIDSIDLDNTGGLINSIGQFFNGRDDVKKFAEKMKGFGEAIVAFGNAISPLDASSIEKATVAANILCALTDADIYDIINLDSGDTTTLAMNLTNLGKGVSEFSNNVSNINIVAVNTACMAINTIREALSGAHAFKISNIANFVKAMSTAGDLGVKGFCSAFVNSEKKVKESVEKMIGYATSTIKANENKFALSMGNMASVGSVSFADNMIDTQSLSYLENSMDAYSNAGIQEIMDQYGISGDYSQVLGNIGNIDAQSFASTFVSSGNLADITNNTGSYVDAAMGVLNDKFGISGDYSSYMGNLANVDVSSFAKTISSSSNLGSVGNAMASVVKEVTNPFDDGDASEGSFVTRGMNILKGILKGINTEDLKGQLKSTMANTARIVKNTWTSFWDENSPSKVSEQDAKYVMEGYALGFKNNTGMVVDAVTSMSEESVDALSTASSELSGYVSENMDLAPTITPYLDLDSLMRDADNLNTLFENGRDLTINSRLGAMTDMFGKFNDESLTGNNQIVSTLNDLRSEVANLQNVVGNLQVIMDSGSLVGAIAPNMDVALGSMAMQRRRGM